ncbi:uncharacterized protein [Spinacia oleracea]|uniref:Uncharacterized protein n=1 Tax=Spinacia oleracea TaxID=3562 RepID=A0ABM3QID6_SPIOL|nr:uncharacterized protein LOC130459657 [Spinacia oleracea]
MGRVSINLVVIAVLAMLCATTAPVLGRVGTTSSEEKQLAVGYKLMLEEMEAIKKAQQNIYQNQKIKMMNSLPINIVESSREEAVRYIPCEVQGSYCNFIFGLNCCSSYFACVPMGVLGGVCVA